MEEWERYPIERYPIEEGAHPLTSPCGQGNKVLREDSKAHEDMLLKHGDEGQIQRGRKVAAQTGP